MTIAAAYARFSSDAQREESIEIQLREIQALIERQGFTPGPVYRDEAVSGWQTHGRKRRTGFDQMLEDAERGFFDAVVVYKLDRFARNVEVAQTAKRRLADANVRLFSVREGEIGETPESWLMSVFGDAMAEYYSRNLSILVKDGIVESARQLKAAGRRIYGYTQDEGDHFVIDEERAEVVREMFRRYIAGDSTNQIADWLNSRQIPTMKGRKWSSQTVWRVLEKDAYCGTYRYCGVEIEDAIPKIVSRADYERVREIRAERWRTKRRKVMTDYLLTDKLWCLRCGQPMCGTSGRGRGGRKYTYYACIRQGEPDGTGAGCNLRLRAGDLEDAVVGSVRELLSDEGAVDEIVSDLMEWAKAQPNRAEEYRQEASRLAREVERLVESIASGIPAESVAEAVRGRQERIADLRRLAALEDDMAAALPDPENVREWLDPYVEGDGDDPEWRKMAVGTFVSAAYADDECVVVALNVTGSEARYVSLEQVQSLKSQINERTPTDWVRVRAFNKWWGTCILMRTTEESQDRLVLHRDRIPYFLLIEKRNLD